MADPILPTVESMITPFIDGVVAARPGSLAHFNAGGRYAHLYKIMRAQAVVALARLADETKSGRLKFATGQPLRTLCASEFNTTLPAAPQLAYGTIFLQRPAPSVGTAPGGIIPAGSRNQFVKRALPNGLPQSDPAAYPIPVAAATYNVVTPVYVAPGQLNATVQVVAVTPGAEANIPIFRNGPTSYSNIQFVVPATPLFDSTFTVANANAAGGSSGITDPVLVAAAKAHAIGQFGPTDGAVIAGCLEQQAVRRVALFPANASIPYAQAYISDESWGLSVTWINRVAQHFADSWQGFGCRVRFSYVQNYQISIAPTIVVANSDALNYTESIDVKVRAAAQSYFNDRPDWYSFRNSALRAAITAADPRILHCPSVTINDAVTGTPLADPVNALAAANIFQLSWAPFITHWFLTDSGVNSTYLPPS